MGKIESRFDCGAVNGESFVGNDFDDLHQGNYDFALLSSSWDRRSACVAGAKHLTFNSAAVLFPEHRDAEGLRDTHDLELSNFVSKNAKIALRISANTGDLRDAWSQIQNALFAALDVSKRRHPAKIFLDLSSCPRYLSLGLVRLCINSGLVSELDIAYAEGAYPRAPTSYMDMDEISFREGEQQAIAVPGYLGDFEPWRKKFYLVSIGFDGWKTLRLVIAKEPDRLMLLEPIPAVDPSYEGRTKAANQALVDRFGLVEKERIRARAGDAIAAWSAISTKSLENPDQHNIFYLCSGNKPHSLALALRAISRNAATLLYNRPTRHAPVNVKPNGVFWKYSIKLAFGTVL